MLSDLARDGDWMRVTYRAEAPLYLNAAVADFRHWRITVGGKTPRAVRGCFGGIAVVVPARAGEIELRYINRASQLYLRDSDSHENSWALSLWPGCPAPPFAAARWERAKLPDPRNPMLEPRHPTQKTGRRPKERLP